MCSGKSRLGRAGSPRRFFVAVTEFLLGLPFVAEGASCGCRAALTNGAKVAVEVRWTDRPSPQVSWVLLCPPPASGRRYQPG